MPRSTDTSNSTNSPDLETALQSWWFQFAPAPADMTRFSEAHHLHDHARTAVALARRCFPKSHHLVFQLKRDPENGEEWLSLNLTVHSPPAEALEHYRRFVDEWVDLVPWPARNQIRLSYQTA